MQLNDLGRLVEQEWAKTASVRTNVEVDLYVVMPNHIHGILIISNSERASRPVGALGMRANSLGAIISQFKSIVTKRSRNLQEAPITPIWKRNYYDRIVHSERALEQIRRYIIANPARWQDDKFYSEWL